MYRVFCTKETGKDPWYVIGLPDRLDDGRLRKIQSSAFGICLSGLKADLKRYRRSIHLPWILLENGQHSEFEPSLRVIPRKVPLVLEDDW